MRRTIAIAIAVVIVAVGTWVAYLQWPQNRDAPARPGQASASAAPSVTPQPGAGDSGEVVPLSPRSPLTAKDRLRVRTVGTERALTDAIGRPILLRGVSVNALVDYGRSHDAPVAVRGTDLQQMAALGFTVMRLAVSWSRVMPKPGELDKRYLRRISSLVQRASHERVYTVISMHSDRYAADLGSGTEFDGAPDWAVATDGLACGDPRPRYYTPCAAAAARHFYRGDSVDGRTGLQWYTDAVSAVAAAGRRGGAGYAGTDILNEPTDPDATPDADATARWAGQLHALQRSIVERLRADGERAPIWIQPQGPRSTGALTDAVLPTLTDDGLVYAPHAYLDVYNGGPTADTARGMRAQYRAFAREARTLRAAVVVGEFPGAAGPGWEELRDEHLKRQTRARFGGIAWLWKQPAGGYGWGTLKPDGGLRADTNAAQVLSAPRLVAGGVPGDVQVAHDGAGTVQVTSDGGATQTIDVWLGTAFGPDTAGRESYRISAATTPGVTGAATTERAWTVKAPLGETPAAGTMVRLRLPADASKTTLSPAG